MDGQAGHSATAVSQSHSQETTRWIADHPPYACTDYTVLRENPPAVQPSSSRWKDKIAPHWDARCRSSARWLVSWLVVGCWIGLSSLPMWASARDKGTIWCLFMAAEKKCPSPKWLFKRVQPPVPRWPWPWRIQSRRNPPCLLSGAIVIGNCLLNTNRRPELPLGSIVDSRH